PADEGGGASCISLRTMGVAHPGIPPGRCTIRALCGTLRPGSHPLSPFRTGFPPLQRVPSGRRLFSPWPLGRRVGREGFVGHPDLPHPLACYLPAAFAKPEPV